MVLITDARIAELKAKLFIASSVDPDNPILDDFLLVLQALESERNGACSCTEADDCSCCAYYLPNPTLNPFDDEQWIAASDEIRSFSVHNPFYDSLHYAFTLGRRVGSLS